MINPSDRYDMDEIGRMMADAGMNLYTAESLLDCFIVRVFDEWGLDSMDLDIEFSCCEGKGITAMHFNKIFREDESSPIKVSVTGEEAVPWESITIGAKSMIADRVHLILLSDDIYRNLRNQ